MADAAVTADSTPQKRVLPARERREPKRRMSSPQPPPPAKKSATTPVVDQRSRRKYSKRISIAPSPADSSPAPEDVIPTKVVSSRPLPSTKQKQASKLSNEEYQSIADSAILAASLHRSRTRWLVDGVFKKYWTKPVKRKGMIDAPSNNPDVKSMQKLGNGTITVEPHKFEVTFYTVRETPAPVAASPAYYNNATPKSTTFGAPPPQYGTYKPPTIAQPLPASQAAPTPMPLKQPVNSTVPPKPISNPATSAPTARAEVKPSPAPAKPNTDPVIQMLAERAAKDPRLKDLMKVVATSKASPQQLKEFQSHIDELNAIARKQEAERVEKERKAEQTTPVQPPPTNSRPVSNVSTPIGTPAKPPGSFGPGMGPTANRPPTLPRPTPYPSYSTPRAEAIIKHIVVEFHGEGASQDRWLFPECAVLDIKYGGLEMLTSFLVERKGTEIIASLNPGGDEEEATALKVKWKPETEYYQAVNMIVRANQHRTIETIARGAKTLPEVQEHMKHVLKTKTRAPEEYLVYRLPREKGLASADLATGDFVDSAVELESEGEEETLQEWYGN